MRSCHGLNASIEQLQKLLMGAAPLARRLGHRSDLSEDILYPMVKFSEQHLLMLLGPPALRYVAHDTGKHPPSPHSHFTDCKLHGKTRTIFAQPDDLASTTDQLGLTGGKVIFEVTVVLMPVGFGHQHFDIPSNNLVRCVAEDLRRCRI